MWLFAILIGLPLIEISLFVTIGAAIGLWWTLAVVLGTAMAGMSIIRAQGGAQHMRKLQSDPMTPLANKAMLVFAGMMLILPGFLTDTLGLLLLLPPVRSFVLARLRAKVRVRTAAPARDVPIDGEYIDLDAQKTPTHQPPSAWTRH
ncbi:FxsA family protein [Falsirhodobacter xinxiangensis]|uniref:FxsA family protein n=1 Tax=Falsirhodobacter xinxiangensis TaxID=2530049 RepID=UPI0010AA804F|nr:FxsA family protein [Rhodobacter xinxiangensis]